MFLNIPTGRDCFKRLVVRYSARLCAYIAYILIVCLLGQTLIVLPLPRVRANVTQMPAPISEPPMPFEVADGASALSLLTRTTGIIASIFAFVVPKETEKIPGIENAVLEPLRHEAANAAAPTPPPAGEIKYDFDNDGKADIGRWRRVATEFKVKNSNSGSLAAYTLGSSRAVAAPGDFNGDGGTDAAVFNAGTWTYKTSPTANAQTISFGTAGDIPYAGDYDGDGTTDAAIFRPSTSTWRIRQSTNGATVSYQWGAAGDIPITGNWDGDIKTDIAVYRNGTWYIRKSSGGNLYLNWGLSYDIPVQGDFDGDGKSDATVFRPTTGTWYILKSSSNWASYSSANWGVWSDQPTPADYDGDGKTDLSVWRPTDGAWYTIRSSDSTFQIQTLGIAGDMAIPSAYTKQVGGTASGDVINAERVKPRNTTGGTNLYSQNFGWGTSLVGLPGRAGLDAGFGIGYNSLVWLKVGNAMYFDPDRGNLTPGFRFGFPVIEPAYYNATRQKWAYMMVTPTGSRVEFLETAASNTYETADSSYTQLSVSGATNPFDPVENLSIKVTSTSGTQMTYTWGVGSYKCTRIQDRNGNYITLAHDSLARLATMTDTLGRVVTVNYSESTGLPSTITQTWKDNNGQGSNVTHTWATFAYTTKAVDTDFATNLSLVGPPDGTVFTVLDKITYPDSSSTKFEYNDYLQVKKVSSIAADTASHILNYVSTSLTTPTSAQPDCPRFTSTSSWVENFNQDVNGVAQPVVVPNSFTANQQYTLPTGGTATGNLVQVTSPDGTVEKTFTGNTGWREGLPIATETWANINSTLTKKRWTWTDYTQDDVNLAYIKNPRVIESKIGDTENSFVRRSTIEYLMQSGSTTLTQYGLASAVNVYDTDQTTVLKRSETDYNLTTAYTSRRIIGIPAESRAYGRENGTLPLVSKMTYAFDEENFTYETNQNISNVIQHDNTNYTASFITGRANLTSTTRWNVEYPTSSSYAVTSRTRYDIAGSPVAKLDPLNRKVAINYTDSFNDNVTRYSFAYPTTLTDPANNSSTVKYRFDIGANVRAQSPAPAGNTTGKITERLFDAIGRVSKETLLNTGAYSRYEYPTNGVQSKVFSTIVDTNNNNTGDTADEVLSESWADGAGRVRRSRTEHPGSTGGWSGSIVEYDILGQVKRSSVPTEISVPNANNPDTWAPAGDDYSRGWLWTYQKYDWKGRVVRKINTDGADSPSLNNSDILITYEGCGCAGGEVTTVQSELVPRDDQPTVNARRTQKTYTDILGRAYKTEVMGWDGSTVFTTTVNSFNGRDQVTNTRQYAGATSASVYQDVTMSYDGHGRMKTRHYPIENSGAATTWNYNVDDSISQLIDPRGAITDFTYGDPRGLTTQIAYTPPTGSSVPDTPNVNFTYDNIGNRTSMATAGVNNTTYTYNSLSQLTSETIDFDALSTNLTIGYTYNLSGGLASITDPFSSTVSYTNDKTGRLTAVSGAAYAQHSNGDYANNIKYRAFGQVKEIDYALPGSQTAAIKMDYDNRLRVSHSEATMPGSTTSFLIKADYSYGTDSRVTAKNDLLSDSWDRTMQYDFAGRLVFNQFGTGPASNGGTKLVYSQTIAYDAFSQMTSRATTHWDTDNGFTATYTNGRKNALTYEGLTYDAAGKIVHSQPNTNNPHDYQDTTFDAAGRKTVFNSKTKGRQGGWLNYVSEDKMEYVSDGEGRPVIEKSGHRSYHINNVPTTTLTANVTGYQVWSSVLGSSLTKLDPNGNKLETSVFVGGAVIATQKRFTENNTANDSIDWSTADPVTGTVGKYSYSSGASTTDVENFEPLGQKIHPHDPEDYTGPPSGTGFWGGADDPEWQCEVAKALYGSFQEWPDHCQKRVLEDLSIGLADLYGWDNHDKGNPLGILILPKNIPPAGPHSGSPDNGLTYAANSMRSAALKSTAKDDDDTNCKPGRPCLPEEKVNVFDDTIPDFIDASQSGSNVAIFLFDTPKDNLTKKAIELRDQSGRRNDCLALVELFKYAGQVAPNVIEATGMLGQVLTGADFFGHSIDRLVNAASRAANEAREQGVLPEVAFENVGFKLNVRGDPGDNQVRHFMGGFLVAASLGSANALQRMNARETGNGVNEVADRNLNAISTSLGGEVQDHNSRYGRDPGLHTQEFMNRIADLIKERACD